MRVKLFRRIYKVLFLPIDKINDRKGKRSKRDDEDEDARGDCDPPDVKNKMIRIAEDLPPSEELEVTIHEALHACDWYKDEEWVELAAKDISRMLFRLGWRRVLRREDEA